MNTFDSSYLTKNTLDAVEYVTELLFTKYSGLDFTIKRLKENTDSVVFYIHDRDTFFNAEFQNFIYVELTRDYLWPKKVLNIVFMYDNNK